MEEEKESQKRQTAVIARISDILQGRFVKAEGWSPNYVVTKNNVKISRTNIIAVVVSVPMGSLSENDGFIVDDGSGRISLKAFDNQAIFSNLKVGDIILIVGRPRQYSNELYLMPEIIRKVENKAWVELRRKELDKSPIGAMEDPFATEDKISSEKLVHLENIEEEIMAEKVEKPKKPAEKPEKNGSFDLLKLIKKYDDGEGADIDAVLKVFGNPRGEEMIKALLMRGEVFEIKAGRLKVLE